MVDDIVGVFLENLFVDNNSIQMKVRGIGDGDGLNIYGVIMALLLMIPYFLSYRYIKYSSIDTPINRFVVNMSILFTVLGMFFLTLTRLQNYFAIPFLFVFADLVHDKVVAKKFQYDILIATIILLFARFSYYASPIAGGSGATHFRMYYPYHSIFNPVVDKERERAIDMQFY